MRCVAHISDLHFGTEDPAMAAGLLEQLAREEPSLVIVSGDLTQRARTSQFQQAAEFLSRIHSPKLVIPGNHDVPLYDLTRRFLSPLARFRKFIQRELNPYYEDEEIAVLGLNTARSLTWKSGRISRDQIRWMGEMLSRVPENRFKAVVTHHPFIPPPHDPEAGIDLVGRAREALAVLDEAGVDLLLAGHLHHGYTGDVRTYYPATSRSIVVAQAGTAISRRVRNEPNSYNLLRLHRDHIQIEARAWRGNAFEKSAELNYRLAGLEWRLEDSRSESG